MDENIRCVVIDIVKSYIASAGQGGRPVPTDKIPEIFKVITSEVEKLYADDVPRQE